MLKQLPFGDWNNPVDRGPPNGNCLSMLAGP
jgi:hypothetical protein